MAFTLAQLVGDMETDSKEAIDALNREGSVSEIDVSLLDDGDIGFVAAGDESLVSGISRLRSIAAMHKDAWAKGAALQAVAMTLPEPPRLPREDTARPTKSGPKSSGAALKRACRAFTVRSVLGERPIW